MSSSAALKARLQDVIKLQRKIFHETYNPEMLRTGSKVLRKGLKGEYVKNYYLPRPFLPKITEFRKLFPDINPADEIEEYRVRRVEELKKRGKGAPKKKKK